MVRLFIIIDFFFFFVFKILVVGDIFIIGVVLIISDIFLDGIIYFEIFFIFLGLVGDKVGIFILIKVFFLRKDKFVLELVFFCGIWLDDMFVEEEGGIGIFDGGNGILEVDGCGSGIEEGRGGFEGGGGIGILGNCWLGVIISGVFGWFMNGNVSGFIGSGGGSELCGLGLIGCGYGIVIWLFWYF